MTPHRLHHGFAAGGVLEHQLAVEREQLKHIMMWAMTARRVGRQPSRLQEGIPTECLVQALVVRTFQLALPQGLEVGRQVPDHQVHQGLDRRCVWILDNQRQARRNVRPMQRRRYLLAIRREARRDRSAILERRTLQRQPIGNVDEPLTFADDLLEARADAVKRVAQAGRNRLEHDSVPEALNAGLIRQSQRRVTSATTGSR